MDSAKISCIRQTALFDLGRGLTQKVKGVFHPIKSYDDYFDVSILKLVYNVFHYLQNVKIAEKICQCLANFNHML
jgi:hypothetical protein